ncbi:MAG: hypothetical protein FJ317_03785 [SAR202 cluster bacterium]|nr:hypothetical protein [SAR202 cluster bacterium]
MKPLTLTPEDARLRIAFAGLETGLEQAKKSLPLTQLLVDQAANLGGRETSESEPQTVFPKERR